MNHNQHIKGKRVWVTSYGPFRGLKGTVVRVNTIDEEGDDPLCFYLVALDSRREPVWFEHTEIEFLDASPSSSSGHAPLIERKE